MKNMFSFVQKVFSILTADPMSPAYSAVNMTICGKMLGFDEIPGATNPAQLSNRQQ
jgi:hypothetical protein